LISFRIDGDQSRLYFKPFFLEIDENVPEITLFRGIEKGLRWNKLR
jgi:hypothetical protein